MVEMALVGPRGLKSCVYFLSILQCHTWDSLDDSAQEIFIEFVKSNFLYSDFLSSASIRIASVLN